MPRETQVLRQACKAWRVGRARCLVAAFQKAGMSYERLKSSGVEDLAIKLWVTQIYFRLQKTSDGNITHKVTRCVLKAADIISTSHFMHFFPTLFSEVKLAA